MEILKIYFKGYLYLGGVLFSVQNSILFDLGRASEASPQHALLPLNAFPALKLTIRLIALF